MKTANRCLAGLHSCLTFLRLALFIFFVPIPSSHAGTRFAEFDFSSSSYSNGALVGQSYWDRVGVTNSGSALVTNATAMIKGGGTYEQPYRRINPLLFSSSASKSYTRIELNVKNAYRSTTSGTGDYWFGFSTNKDQSGTIYDRIYFKKTADGINFTVGLNAGISAQYNDELLYNLNTDYTFVLLHESIDGTKNDRVTLLIKPASSGSETLVPALVQSFNGTGTYRKADGSTGSLTSAGSATTEPTIFQSLGFYQRPGGTTINGTFCLNQIAISKITVGSSLDAVGLPLPSSSTSFFTLPNQTFVQQATGEIVTTITDASGSIPTLQSAIQSSRAANPSRFLVINLQPGAEYLVTTTPLTLDSKMCLYGSGSKIVATPDTTATSLIKINSGASCVSVQNLTLLGAGIDLYGIETPDTGVGRVNLDLITIRQTGRHGIFLQGQGPDFFDNEMTVTRCDISDVTLASGIRIRNATQAVVMDNLLQNNLEGLVLDSSAHCTLMNNRARFNANQGIRLIDSSYNKVLSNLCTGNATSLAASGSTSLNKYNFFISNEFTQATVGFSLAGYANVLYDNYFSTSLTSALIVESGSGVNRILPNSRSVGSGTQEIFTPPTITNPHTNSILGATSRIDLAISATSLSAIQTLYDAARSQNPDHVLVLHLLAPEIIGDAPLVLNSKTCVLLDGTILLSPNISAFSLTSGTFVSISGGCIDGANTTGRPGIYLETSSRIILDHLTLINFGSKSNRIAGSDVIALAGCTTPCLIESCTIDGGAARGIWTKGITASSISGQILLNNTISNLSMDGIDFDVTTSTSLAYGNICHSNIRYGIFVEEGASLNQIIANVCTSNEIGVNVYAYAVGPTINNSFLANTCSTNLRGIRFGATSLLETSHNFAFNNSIFNSTQSGIDAQGIGTENYISQNYFSGNAANLGSTLSSIFFNSSSTAAPFVSTSGTFSAWQEKFSWVGASSQPNSDPNQNGLPNLLEYALDLNPIGTTLVGSLPTSFNDSVISGGPWSGLTYRRNKTASDLIYQTMTSTDLVNWSTTSANGSTVFSEVTNTNPDGDGSAELIRLRSKILSTEPKRFFKLQIQKN